MPPEENTSQSEPNEERSPEIGHVVKRLAALVEEHIEAARPLGIDLRCEDFSAVIAALREHARGGPGLPVPGARDAIHQHVLNRLFEELVEEPSNIFAAKDHANGKEPAGYDAMEAGFWIECLDFMETELSDPS